MNENISNEELIQFLDNEELKKIVREYREASEMAESAGFNIFRIISDYYYRENFHGDILMAFLDPEGQHGEGDKFLKIFIKMLGVDSNNYESKTTVEREVGLTGRDRGRIDFVIKNNNESDPHCIIIENKLYDAVDMPNQLPRYDEEMKKRQGYQVDKIAYLPLSFGKRPDDIKEVEGKLKIVPAITVSDSEQSLVKNWIDPCIKAASNLDCISILRQYKRLLITLKPELAKYRSTMDFIEYLHQDNSNLENAIAAKKMLNNLGKHLAIRFNEKLKERTFETEVAESESGRKICLMKGYSLWIYCAETENLDYVMKIQDAAFSNPRLESIKWLSDTLKEVLEKHLNSEKDPCLYFKLTEESDLIDVVCKMIEMANKQEI